ncbi:YbdD/YjiX family protein [Gordonia sp. LSe1-13]|uniref:YbdD/YjiX family protein n=1 Tax=Gordonia sesuvii TaxID=3116777 RepID=A0ABU7MI67_9ACTN|nr:YbdD/YjiX family protein [Gordonia sp. LSe1-13]
MGRLRRAVDAVRWYVGSLMGDHDYRRYVEHMARTHPREPVLSESAYWRGRYADQDRRPGARCC